MKTPRRSRPATQSLDRPRVALIEDDPDFRSLVRGWLGASCDTMSFASAEEWLDEDEDALAPDLMITDVNMPGVDGITLCRTVRARPGYESLPILFLTGVDSDEGFLRGQEAGASSYLTKPVDRKVLLACVSDLLGRPL